MKKQFVSNNTRASVIRFGAAVLLFMNLQASAAPINKGDDPYVTVKYVGTAENGAQFQVDLVNDMEEAYLFQITDESGAVLYKEKIDKKVFTKKFEWNNADLDATKLIFTVTGLKSKKTQSYAANTELRTVRNVVISKM